MQNHELESLAREALRRAAAHAPVEDSRVEFKSEFIEPAKAARRIAAHANASAYEQIIWIFGAKEDGTIIGINDTDFLKWFSKVAAFFNGEAPRPKEIAFGIGDKTVMAVAFSTDAPPYVVSNPSGGIVGFEVPWRDATATRSANRTELLQILAPQMKLPKIEILRAAVSFGRTRQNFESERYAAKAQFDLYVAQLSLERIALPIHRVKVDFDIGGNHGAISFSAPRFFGTNTLRVGPVGSSPRPRASAHVDGIEATPHEAIIRGFGKLNLAADAEGQWGPKFFANFCTLKATCGLAGDHRAIVLKCVVTKDVDFDGPDYAWHYVGDISNYSARS